MKTVVATAPQASVPKPKTRAQSRQNFLLIRDASGASIVTMTECWSPITRAVIRMVFLLKGWGWQAPTGNSALILWDKKHWKVVKRGKFLGHGYLRGVSDARYVPWVLLKNVHTGEQVWVLAIHPCPIPTKKAPHMVPQAKEFQRRYYARLRKFIIEHPNLPVLLMGDWNDTSKVFGDWLNGRRVRYAGKGIIRIATVNGAGNKGDTKWNAERNNVAAIEQPHSDHPIIRGTRELIEAA